jgi:guanylate kinase
LSNSIASAGGADAPRLIVVSGPTASGKSTLWRRLVQHPQVTFSVSATTRKARPGEVDGKDYFYVSEERFSEMIAAGELLEHANVHGSFYGTLRSEIQKAFDAGLSVVLEIDVQGYDQLQQSDLPMVSVFVNPPSLELLAQRLRDRKSETEEQMARRLSIVEKEMARANDYQHVVINDDLEVMIQQVHDLLGLEVQPQS